VGTAPAAIAITPNGKTALVANDGSSTVTPMCTATDRPDRAISVGLDPIAITIAR
jgi:DNA-binding beta-propeller fold protein YncE